MSLNRILKTLKKKQYNSVRLIHHNEKTLIKHLSKKLPVVVAGGGKVINVSGETLFIFRNDKWDLPKGKAEKNESIQETAIREVEEETGVENIIIESELPTTYHIFKRRGITKLKVTYWFNMKTNFEGELFPQENEGITKAVWHNEERVTLALQNSYANIKLLF